MKWKNELETPFTSRLSEEKINELAAELSNFELTKKQKLMCNKHVVAWSCAFIALIPLILIWTLSTESYRSSSSWKTTLIALLVACPLLFLFGYSTTKYKLYSRINLYLDEVNIFPTIEAIESAIENFSIDEKRRGAVNSLTNQPLRNQMIHKLLKFDQQSSYVIDGKYNGIKFEVECARYYPKGSMYTKPIDEDNRLWDAIGPEWINTLLVYKENPEIQGELGIQARVLKGKKQVSPVMFGKTPCIVENTEFNTYFEIYGSQELANKVLTAEKQKSLIEMFTTFNNVLISYSSQGLAISFEVANNFLWPRALMENKFSINKKAIIKSIEYAYIEFLQIFSYYSIVAE